MDAIDERLLALLVEDGRASYTVLGDRVGLSAPAVKRRVDRLVADGIVRGFTAVIDQAHLGWTTEAYVEVHCHGTIGPEELRASFAGVPEVQDAATVTGQADAILRIVARDVRHLEDALERVRTRAAAVERTETAIVLSRLVERRAALGTAD
ncbi:transcriptional regulator, AsnC family [Aeromicrobium marinum DSM 15272]|uniref:Transcriptional regulator, AsnC family n=1 Tax=Aeromicrobium marinum DSM 15272 TaxID=585531 RepID=E2SG66_9ACTN|nr:Lrp/AsnC family transcriptional regulator [Aeromicrobium marinum]EFQ81823.1 transcriptional regulator, AsnC family [Aeromicrobium marinum DSM 15272]